MPKPDPAPFVIRLLAFVLGAHCLMVIVTVTIMVPGFMVANWGGSMNQSMGVFEGLHGAGLALAGIGVPFLVYSVARCGWWILVGLLAAFGAVFLWGTFGGNGDRAASALLSGLVALHGMALLRLCGMRIRRADIELHQPDAPMRY